MSQNKVTEERINQLFEEAKKEAFVVFDKCTLLSVQLDNGFILTESSACVDPANFDFEVGYNICKERIINQLWELEGYLLQNNQ